MYTDASGCGVGAVLSQHDDEGIDHPVAYYSRKLLPREQKYSTVEQECLAINLAFSVYLLGKPFVVQTDHRTLRWLDWAKDTNARLTRWSLALQPYQFTVENRQGKANCNADALSRMSSEECCTPKKEGKDVKNAIPRGSPYLPTDQSDGSNWRSESSTYKRAPPDNDQLPTQD